jgi:UDP-N-acetylmuramate--alanine ligase
MRIYISGISGTGLGPLALMAKAAGMEVCGSDLARGAICDELVKAGIEVKIGEQDGEFLREKLEEGIDWFVYTSALPEGHAELKLARESGVKCTKRDDFTAYLVEKLGLKMVAVAGTHGKTTTTSMIVWAALKLSLPVSYIVGTTLGFAPSGAYHKGDKYFIYEADEYDRNFLKYHPWLAVIPAVSYDHPDIYPTKEDYEEAFRQFKEQSEMVIEYRDGKITEKATADENDFERVSMYKPENFGLAGEARRIDAALAANAVLRMQQNDFADKGMIVDYDTGAVIEVLNEFPGVGRRFERLKDGLYTDYAHHPEEIAATIGVALDECKKRNRKGIVVIYQPHQNVRQYEVKDGYRDAFVGADEVLWLPTYLTRENPGQAIIRPEEFIDDLSNSEKAEAVELDDVLVKRIQQYLKEGYLVVLMAAGSADVWLRDKI